MSNEPLIKLILTQKSGGTAEMPGLDQVQRLYAFAPLHEGTSSNVYVSVGIPNAVAFGAANEVFARNMALLFLVAVLAVIAAWVGSNVFVLRRINALADAARRLAKGDMSARTGLPHGTEELGQLARSFDDMATALQRVNRALKTLSVSNRSVVRATDEQTLVAEMCRIIVEVGGYRFAWIGYAEDNEHKLIRPTAEFGFDGGMEVLSKWMTGVTWADTPLGRGSVGRAVRTAKPYVAGNFPENPDLAPWRDEAIRRGYGSCAAFPLCVKDKPVGVLAIYSAEPDAFDAEELELLDEAARDLAFGITVLRTRTEHDRANATISRMAYYDGLTGLPNHVYFDERLRRTLSETSTGDPSTALYVIGLNRLREINDALGFHQGDVLLKQVGMRIRSVFREEVLVARMRGDEFAVLLAVRDDEETAEIAQKILNALKAPFAISDLSLDVSVAVGISVSPQHGSEATLLLRNADVAMQQAKKSTKGYVFYAPEQDEDGTRRLSLAGELRRAIEGEELVLYYQPKIDMRDSRVCGVEALVRWNHPLRGLIPPDEFIALAEHTGLIKPLTDWVVDAALRQSSAWRKEGLALPIAVNLSARNLHDEELIYQLDQRFAVWRADPEWLEMEITEGAVMQDPDGALDVLRRLSSMGIKLFIDDFGTGYSSLGYLKKLPVDAIKIDKSFVIDMLSDADSAAIVRSTIGLAHDLDKKVVAEGVEGAALWNQLVGLGCDVAQGYFISKPVPAEQFKDWFDRRARSQRLGKQSLS